MGIATHKGTFTANTSTGNQAVTGVGFQPSVVLFWHTTQTAEGYAANAYGGFGAGVSSSARKAIAWADQDNLATVSAGRAHANAVIYQIDAGSHNPNILAKADLVSLDSDGFTINWSDAPATAIIVHYLALGGTSMTGAAVGEFSAATSTGNQAVTGAGVAPDYLLLFTVGNATAPDNDTTNIQFSMGHGTSSTARGMMGATDNDFSGSVSSISYHRTDKIISVMGTSGTGVDGEADLVSLDADGFTINWSNAPAAAALIFYVALEGGSYAVGAETQKTSTGTKATTGAGFEPAGLFLFGGGRAASTSWDITSDGAITIGACDGSLNEGYAWSSWDDASDPTDTNVRTVTTAVFGSSTHPSTTTAEADISSLDSDGFTLDWTTADGTARQIFWAAFGPPEATTADKSGSDSAALSESKTLSVVPTTVTDSGTAAETSSIVVTLAGTDAAAMADVNAGIALPATDALSAADATSSLSAAATSSDAASAADANAGIALPGTDSGTAADATAALAASAAASDASSASEGSSTLTAATTATDALSEAEGSSALAAEVGVTDSGTGSEGTPGIALPGTDAASAADATASLAAAVSSTDASQALADATAALTAAVAGLDAVALAESGSLATALSASDTGGLAEAAAIAAALDAADALALAEAASIAADLSSTDSGTGSDSGTVQTGDDKTGTDTATLSEAAVVAALLTAADSLTAADASSATADVAGSDSGTAADASSLSAALSAADQAAAAELAALAASVAAVDSAALATAVTLAAALQAQDDGLAVDAALTLTALLVAADSASLGETSDILVVIGGVDVKLRVLVPAVVWTPVAEARLSAALHAAGLTGSVSPAPAAGDLHGAETATTLNPAPTDAEG